MADVSDEMMRTRIAQAAPYTLVLLRKAPDFDAQQAFPIIWEHGRRNMSLQLDGIMPIICPIRDDSSMAGAAILTVGLDRARELLDADPGVRAGIFTYELHACTSFPGSVLPPPATPEPEFPR
ncbi:hypothetical protein ACWDSJ_06325 [Nocardia sp. NPDC003482]|uniref:hypothetical protein n=1 Tax=Nocardia sp. NPDC004068 TaxID=3364303 RepID=UPI0036CB4893